MPLLSKQALVSSEPSTLTFTDLDGTSDSFNYSGGNEVLVLQNTSGGDVTVTLLGDSASTVTRAGITNIDVSGGKVVVLAANTFTKVTLKDAFAYLTDSNGQPKITGASADIKAAQLTF